MEALSHASARLTAAELFCLLSIEAVLTGLVYGEVVARPGQRPDFTCIKSNKYFDQLVLGLPKGGHSALENWLGVAPEQLTLRTQWDWMTWDGDAPLATDAWIPQLGKTLHLIFKRVTENRFLATVSDVTESRHHEQEVLEANLLLRRLEKNATIMSQALMAERQQLLCATVLHLQPVSDYLSKRKDRSAVASRYAELLKSLSSGLTEHYLIPELSEVVGLVVVNDIYNEVCVAVREKYPHTTVTSTSLPVLLGDRCCVRGILFNLLSAVSKYAVVGSRLHLAYHAEGVESKFVLEADNLKSSMEEFSFLGIDCDLQMLLFRRLVLIHGGCFEILNPEPSSLRVIFSLGLPPGTKHLSAT